MSLGKPAAAAIGIIAAFAAFAGPAFAATTITAPTGPRAGEPAARAITGTATAGAFVTVTADKPGSATPDFTETVAANGSGDWTTASSVVFDESTWTITADEGGSVDTEIVTFDLTAPIVTLTAPAARTNDTTPGFSGSKGDAAEDIDAVVVEVFSGGMAIGTPVATDTVVTDGTSWTLAGISSALTTDGQYTVRVTQTDDVGNTDTDVASFVLDRTGPIVAVATPTDGGYFNEADGANPTISGTAGTDADHDSDVRVRIYEGGTTSGAPAFDATVTHTGGNWDFPVPAPGLLERDYTLRVTQADDAGNQGESVTTFVSDRTDPSVAVTTPATNGSKLLTFEPTLSGTKGNATTPSLDGAVNAVFSKTGETDIPATFGGSGSSFTASPSSPLPSAGTWTLTVNQSDAAGNAATPAVRTFSVLDRNLTMIQPLTPRVTDVEQLAGASPKLTEGATNPITVRIHQGVGTGGPLARPAQTDTLVNSSDSDYSVIPGSLSDGVYTAQASLVDEGGNTITSNAVQFEIDTTGPNLVLSTPAAGPTQDRRPTVSGTTDETSDVTVELDPDTPGQPTITQTVTPTGSGPYTYSSTPGADIAEDAYTVRVTQVDILTSTVLTRAIRVDDTDPGPPSLMQVTTGCPAAPCTFTGDATPTITGRVGTAVGDENPTVEVLEGSTVKDVKSNVSRDGDGDFTITPDSGDLTATGFYTVRVTQTDEAGNSRVTATALTFTLDLAAPSVAQDVPAAGLRTNDPTPDLGGTAGTALAIPGVSSADDATVRIEISDEDGDYSHAPYSLPVYGSGRFDGPVPSNLPQGRHFVRVFHKDAVGNTGSTTARQLIVDLTEPAVAVTTPGPSGMATNDESPELSGTAGTATGDGTGPITVEVRNAAGQLIDTDADGGPGPAQTTPQVAGEWTYIVPVDLADGTYTVTAKKTDIAGNVGTATARTFEVDTVLPTPELNEPADGTATDDTTPTFRGVADLASDGGGRPGVDVLITGTEQDGDPVDRALSTTRNDTTGVFELTVPNGSPLEEGDYTARVIQEDVAGNRSGADVAAVKDFSVDNGPPVVDIETQLTGGKTASATPTFTGNAEPGPLSVTLSAGPAVSSDQFRILRTQAEPDGTYSVKVTPSLPDGVYTAQAEQVDAARNVGRSEPLVLEVDASAPELSITGPANGSATRDLQPLVTGVAGTGLGDGEDVRVVLDGPVQVTMNTKRDAVGAFTAEPSAPLPEGSYSVRAFQTDSVGNEGRSELGSFLIDGTAPNVVVQFPPAPFGRGTRNVEVIFGADESATFDCTLDDQPLMVPCRSPLRLENLRAGRHMLEIGATDSAGNADPTPMEVQFIVDVAPPNMRLSKRVAADREGRVRLVLDCPKRQAIGPCAGNLTVRRGGRSLIKVSPAFRIPTAETEAVVARLNKIGKRLLRRAGRKGVRVRVGLVARDGSGNIGRASFERTLIRAGARR